MRCSCVNRASPRTSRGRADLHLTREVNGDTPLSQTFVMHADGFSGVEMFARQSEQPPRWGRSRSS